MRGWERTVYHLLMSVLVLTFFCLLAWIVIDRDRVAKACARYGYAAFEWTADRGRPVCIDTNGHRMPLRLLQTER